MSLLVSSCDSELEQQVIENGALTKKGRYVNPEMVYSNSFSKFLKISWEYIRAKRKEPRPKVLLPVKTITRQVIETAESPTLFRLGHSTILFKLDGEFFLTDPVFSDRSSPVQWAGPKRFHEVPIREEELPDIRAILISHDHYDHLDRVSILKLAEKTKIFVTPLKVGERLIRWGVDPKKIIEKDWWQSVECGTVTLTAAPAQHFSGRGIFDKDQTLWVSWIIRGNQANLYFSGDSGYFSGFKEIGEKYGPFDITMIESGAYHELWAEVHMLPEETLQAHLDLKGKVLLPIHNSTFDLALHDWYEPLEIVTKLAEENDVEVLTPMIGEAVTMNGPDKTSKWWRQLSSQIK